MVALTTCHMKYVAYIRRSETDKKKQIQSIPIQLDWVKKSAGYLGVEVIKTFIDKGTGTKTGREGLDAMVAFINSYGEPLGVLSWKVSRLSRNPTDEGTIKQAILDGKIGHLFSSDEQYDKNSNQILLGVRFGAAIQYSIDLGRSVTFGLKRKVELGYMPGVAPLGYLNDPTGLKGQRKIYKDPARFDLLKGAWKKLLTGAYSVEMVRKELTGQGFTKRNGKPVPRSTFYRIFSSPFYSGHYYWGGELYKGKHPPMVSPADFEKVQDIVQGKGTKKNSKKVQFHNGILSCGECGYSITTECHTKRIKSTGETKKYTYLRCTYQNPNVDCKQKYVRYEEVEKQVVQILSGLKSHQFVIDLFFNRLREINKGAEKKIIAQRNMIVKEQEQNEAMIDTLVDNLNSNIIDKGHYQKAYDRYKSKSVCHPKKTCPV